MAGICDELPKEFEKKTVEGGWCSSDSTTTPCEDEYTFSTGWSAGYPIKKKEIIQVAYDGVCSSLRAPNGCLNYLPLLGCLSYELRDVLLCMQNVWPTLHISCDDSLNVRGRTRDKTHVLINVNKHTDIDQVLATIVHELVHACMENFGSELDAKVIEWLCIGYGKRYDNRPNMVSWCSFCCESTDKSDRAWVKSKFFMMNILTGEIFCLDERGQPSIKLSIPIEAVASSPGCMDGYGDHFTGNNGCFCEDGPLRYK